MSDSSRAAMAALKRQDPKAWGPATEALASLGTEGLECIVSRVRALAEDSAMLTGATWISTSMAIVAALSCSVWTFIIPARDLDHPPETFERGLFQLGLVLFMVFVASVPLVLVPLGRRRVAREVETLSNVWTTLCDRLSDLGGVGVLARGYRERALRFGSRGRILAMAEEMTDEAGAKLTGEDVEAVAALLRAGDVALAGAAISVLSHCTRAQAAGALESYAALSESPSDLAAMATEAASRVRARTASGRDVRSLLRPSTEEHAESPTLLRPASGGEEAPQQLLRGGQGTDEAE